MKTIRIALSAAAWVLCTPGMFLHGLVTLAMLAGLSDRAHGPIDYVQQLLTHCLPVSFLAWPVLALMNAGWILNRRVHWLWPVVGSMLPLIWLVPMGPAGLMTMVFVAPGVVLAVYLVVWHLAPWQQGNDPPKPTSQQQRG